MFFKMLIILSMFLSTIGLSNSAETDRHRYRQLVNVINKNTGFAHLTRGVNACTSIALYRAVTIADIPILKSMTLDKDYVINLAAISTLGDMGELGRNALTELLAEKKVAHKLLVEEELERLPRPNDYDPGASRRDCKIR